MSASNRQIAIEYLVLDFQDSVEYHQKRIKEAMRHAGTTELDFNTFALIIDPAVQTATLHHEWFACEPEVFELPDLMELTESVRKRCRSN